MSLDSKYSLRLIMCGCSTDLRIWISVARRPGSIMSFSMHLMANCSPVAFSTPRRTTENSPLRRAIGRWVTSRATHARTQARKPATRYQRTDATRAATVRCGARERESAPAAEVGWRSRSEQRWLRWLGRERSGGRGGVVVVVAGVVEGTATHRPSSSRKSNLSVMSPSEAIDGRRRTLRVTAAVDQRDTRLSARAREVQGAGGGGGAGTRAGRYGQQQQQHHAAADDDETNNNSNRERARARGVARERARARAASSSFLCAVPLSPAALSQAPPRESRAIKAPRAPLVLCPHSRRKALGT